MGLNNNNTMKKFVDKPTLELPILTFVLSIFLLVGSSGQLKAQPKIKKIWTIGSVPKPYDIKLLGTSAKSMFPAFQFGFRWRTTNEDSKDWRPQGITGACVDANNKVMKDNTFSCIDNCKGKDCVPTPITLVSWYHYNDGNTVEYGAKVSVVNWGTGKYRHILLLDDEMKDFGTMHAGGIAVVDGMLHVADSRKNQNKIRVFDLNKVLELDKKVNKYYQYVLLEEFSYPAPLTPSTLSYDADKDEMAIGKFKQTSEKGNPICWLTPPKNADAALKFKANEVKIYRIPNKYRRIQGIASRVLESGNRQVFLSCSYGKHYWKGLKPYTQSTIYKFELKIDANTSYDKGKKLATPITPLKVKKYFCEAGDADGLESLMLTDNYLWTLTEFAEKRKVVALDWKKL